MMRTTTASLPEPTGSIDMEELREYDQNGNLIYCKDSDGFEWWRKYDGRGNIIYYCTSDGYGFEEWYDYDENNNLISTRTNREY
jgi:YD repeat-containing protein